MEVETQKVILLNSTTLAENIFTPNILAENCLTKVEGSLWDLVDWKQRQTIELWSNEEEKDKETKEVIHPPANCHNTFSKPIS